MVVQHVVDPPNGISLGAGINNILVSKYARTQCLAVAWSLTLCLVKIATEGAHKLPKNAGATRYSTVHVILYMCTMHLIGAESI